MSAYISGAVWLSGPRQQTRRFVLLAIADNANDEGFAWPSLQTIADKCLMTTRTVSSCIADLESEGWLQVNRKAIDAKGNSYQILLDKLTFKRPKSREIASCDNRSQVKLAAESQETDDITIRKNHQESPSYLPETSSGDFALISEVPANGNGHKPPKKKETDPRHTPCRERIFAFYQAVNEKDPPWGPQDAKQLSDLLKQTPKLTVEEFDQWLANYSESEGLNFANRPAQFLPRLVSFANGPLSKYGRPING